MKIKNGVLYRVMIDDMECIGRRFMDPPSSTTTPCWVVFGAGSDGRIDINRHASYGPMLKLNRAVTPLSEFEPSS